MTERGLWEGAKRSLGIVWDAQRVNNYNVQIVWCMLPATFALLLLIRNAQRALPRIKNKSRSKHRHARTHAKVHTRTHTHTETQLTTMTPSINSGRVDVCYAGVHCEKRLREKRANKLDLTLKIRKLFINSKYIFIFINSYIYIKYMHNK